MMHMDNEKDNFRKESAETHCMLCPVKCGANRSVRAGYCGVRGMNIAKYYLHPYEEPCISFAKGSGTIFFTGCNLKCVFCQNYDSPYLLYPLTAPHGASRSGLLTFSPANITAADRVELPVESGFMKLLDLDRCYSVSRVPVSGGGELVLYDLHLSAYTSDGTIATEQLALLLADMQAEYEKGSWCVAGGDFNKDLLGDSSVYFGEADQEYSWAQPIPEGVFDSYDVQLVAPLDENDPVPSCRNADGPYHDGQYVLTVDGFLVTPNVAVDSAAVLDTGFAYSDHNPVQMTFTLQK